MKYLIYLRHSFLRMPKRHITLFIILTCAMILPLIISIHRDSLIFGYQTQALSRTYGYSYEIANAKTRHESLLNDINISGLSFVFLDGRCFVEVPVEYLSTPDETLKFELNLIGELNNLQNNEFTLFKLSDYGSNENNKDDDLFVIIIGVVILLSLLIIQSSYKNHIAKFNSDIGILISLGAKNRQVKTILLFDLFITFLASAAVAVASSSIIMYFVYEYFLGVKDIGNLSWIIYSINPISIVLILTIFLVYILFMQFLSVSFKLLKPTIVLIKSGLNQGGAKIKHYRKKMTILKNPISSLNRLLSKRTKKPFTECLIISIPISAALVFAFNYIAIGIEELVVEPTHDIKISREYDYSGNNIINIGFSNEEIDLIKSLDKVGKVIEIYNLPSTKYTVEDSRMKGSSSIPSGNRVFAQTDILLYSNIKNESINDEFNSSKYNIAVNKNHKYLKYEIGDKITLYTNFQPIAELTVVELLDLEQTDRLMQIYFTDEMFGELTMGEVVNGLGIELYDKKDHKEVETILKNKFSDSKYTIFNEYAMYEKNIDSSAGLNIISFFIYIIMFAFILIILYTKLTDYVESEKKNIKTLYTLGASESVIHKSYLLLSIKSSIVSIVIPFFLGISGCIIVNVGTNYHMQINIFTILIHLIFAFLIFLSYNLPIHLSVNKNLKELNG